MSILKKLATAFSKKPDVQMPSLPTSSNNDVDKALLEVYGFAEYGDFNLFQSINVSRNTMGLPPLLTLRNKDGAFEIQEHYRRQEESYALLASLKSLPEEQRQIVEEVLSLVCRTEFRFKSQFHIARASSPWRYTEQEKFQKERARKLFAENRKKVEFIFPDPRIDEWLPEILEKAKLRSVKP